MIDAAPILPTAEPARDDSFEALDGLAQADLVRDRRASARELAEAAIRRIEARNPRLNAVIATRFARARQEADLVDADPDRRAAPFAGVPFLVKDLSEMAGEPLTFGSALFRDFRGWTDEPLIACARAAGLIPLGKTNTPEFGLIGTTEPLLHGPTQNPWAMGFSAGGSSGGAAAAVAAGMTPIAQASDGGGSIRIPASACGVFGLKPSRGVGLGPKREAPGGLSVTLCVSRSVRDSAAFLEMSDAARAARSGGRAPIGPVRDPINRPLRIALAPDSFTGGVPDPEAAAMLADVAGLCVDLGHHVETAQPSFDGEAATEHFLTLWSAIPAGVVRRFALLRALACGWRVWRWPPLEEALDDWSRGLAARFEAREAAAPGQIERANAFFAQAQLIYDAFFERYDVMLSPVQRRGRLPLGEQAPTVPFETLLARAVDNVGYTPTQNALGAPAMSVPLHWTADGHPVGAHFAAKPGDEALLLGLAYQLEAARPWAGRRPPAA